MANVDNPHGFRPIRTLGGGEFRIESLALLGANAIIGKFDLVTLSLGLVDRSAVTDTAICGIAMEAKAANSADTEILVLTNPDIVMEAQTDDGVATLVTQADMSLNADFIVGNAVNGLSIMEIDDTSGAAGAALPLKMIGLFPAIGNAFGEFNRLECIIQNHIYKSVGTAGV